MPMVWNAEADAKLFAAVMKTSDISFNYAAIAQLMGPDCSAKAVTHRITNLRKIAATLSNNGNTTPADTNGNGAGVPKTPNTPKKRGTEVSREDGTPTPNKKAKTPTPRKGKAKKSEAVVKDEEAETKEESIPENGESKKSADDEEKSTFGAGGNVDAESEAT